MKYPKIAALVPKGEHFDESAIVNEGGFISVGHLAAIETELSTITSAETAQALEQANSQIEDLTGERDTLQTQYDSAQTTISERDKKIGELEKQVEELGKDSSGNGSVIVTQKDEIVPEIREPKSALSNPNHPLNLAATQLVERKKEREKIKL